MRALSSGRDVGCRNHVALERAVSGLITDKCPGCNRLACNDYTAIPWRSSVHNHVLSEHFSQTHKARLIYLF